MSSKRKFIHHLLPALLASGLFWSPAVPAASVDEARLSRELSQAEYHVREFEKEVQQQRGGEKQVYRTKKTALDRVQQLKLAYPDDPRVEELFQRTKTALMQSKGNITQIDPSWLKYLQNEDELKKTVSQLSQTEWDRILKAQKDVILDDFPAPDVKKVMLTEMEGRTVVLKNVSYPGNQFYGGTGEYAWHGKPSSGYYFVALDGRQWLGPYEAIKRFRRNVDTSLADVTEFTVLGKIVDVAAEIPSAESKKVGSFQMGWVVEPVAIYVPGHVAAWYDAGADGSGVYAGEEKVAEIKKSWYTHTSVPDNVQPQQLLEIFMSAIKEKNFDLYVACINPRWTGNPNSNAQLRYHWDLHQERFHREYVHATFDKPHPIQVIKGFNASDEQENFFLDDEQKDLLQKTQGDLVETVTVDSRAYDKNGKQIGSPHPHVLIRTNGGRWYVDDYMVRF